MSSFVLVHGGFHGPWCWSRITPLLTAAGHRVHAPDLHGDDPDATKALARALHEAKREPGNEVILLGHSSGGMVISELAERQPDGIGALVYLSAFLLPAGATPHSLGRDEESLLASALVTDEARGTVSLRPDRAQSVLYGECDPAEATWAAAQLVPEPIRTAGQPPPPLPSEQDWTARSPVRRFYVECLRDKALGPHMQRRMYTALPCEKVYSLSADHSPFLSMPTELADCLLDIADRVRSS